MGRDDGVVSLGTVGMLLVVVSLGTVDVLLVVVSLGTAGVLLVVASLGTVGVLLVVASLGTVDVLLETVSVESADGRELSTLLGSFLLSSAPVLIFTVQAQRSDSTRKQASAVSSNLIFFITIISC